MKLSCQVDLSYCDCYDGSSNDTDNWRCQDPNVLVSSSVI